MKIARNNFLFVLKTSSLQLLSLKVGETNNKDIFVTRIARRNFPSIITVSFAKLLSLNKSR